MQKPTLKRFQHYLASQGRPWTQQDDARWQLLSTLYPASEEALLHGWVVQALNNQDLTLALGALWLMQYPAGQMVVASRWPQAPHAPPRIVVPPLDSRAAHEKRPRLAVVQWRSMTSLFSPPSAQVQALLSPLACMERWTSKEAARDELELLAYNAIGERSQSLWWNYIYLHEEYVSRFSPEQRDMLPGFPDMDTAVKVSAPSVYNWYYFRHGLPTTPWTDLHFSDLTLCLRAGALSTQEATNACLFMLGTNILPFSAHDRDTPPLWLCATWSKTSAWVPFLNYVKECALPCAGAGVLDRHAMAPALLWQWQCTQRKDIGFLTADDAAQALDGLRMKSINDNLRTQCEDHFLSYFPEYKARAEIAFSLGGPLWVDTVESFGPSLSLDVFESGPEALHSK